MNSNEGPEGWNGLFWSEYFVQNRVIKCLYCSNCSRDVQLIVYRCRPYQQRPCRLVVGSIRCAGFDHVISKFQLFVFISTCIVLSSSASTLLLTLHLVHSHPCSMTLSVSLSEGDTGLHESIPANVPTSSSPAPITLAPSLAPPISFDRSRVPIHHPTSSTSTLPQNHAPTVTSTPSIPAHSTQTASEPPAIHSIVDDKGDHLYYRTFISEDPDLDGIVRLCEQELSEP